LSTLDNSAVTDNNTRDNNGFLDIVDATRKMMENCEGVDVNINEKNCVLCDFSAESDEHLREHIIVAHPKVKKESAVSQLSPGKRKKKECSDCSFSTQKESVLKRHVRAVHLKIKNFKCDFCEHNSSRRPDLLLHMKRKHGRERRNEEALVRKRKEQKCNLCSYSTYLRSSLDNHMNSVHPKTRDFSADHTKNQQLGKKKKDPMKCPFCSFSVDYPSDLTRHLKAVHLKIKDFSCDLCDFKCSTQNSIRHHRKAKHLDESEKRKCSDCSYSTYFERNLTNHVNAVHLKIKNFGCDFCDYKCSKKSDLKPHVKTHLKSEDFTCDFCDYKCTRRSHIMSHMKSIHMKIKDICCDFCAYKCSRKSDILSHMKRKHPVETFVSKPKVLKCDICSYLTYLPSSMENHVKTVHLKKREFACASCDFQCVHKHTMLQLVQENQDKETQHEKKVENQDEETQHEKKVQAKNIRCTLCTYKCSRKSNLKVHIKSQHQGKITEHALQCSYCSFSAEHPSSMDRHEQAVHLNIKYSCDICDRKYSRKSDQKNHMKRKHPYAHLNIIYSCDICDKKYSRKSDQKNHMKKTHPDTRYERELINEAEEPTCDLNVKEFSSKPCDLQSVNEYAMQNIIQENRDVDIQDEIEAVACLLCGFLAECESEMVSHAEKMHVEEASLPCSL
jgi:hypothetical protein